MVSSEQTNDGKYTQKKERRDKQEPPHTSYKILAGHMLGNDALECVDNFPILYSSDENIKCIHNSINY